MQKGKKQYRNLWPIEGKIKKRQKTKILESHRTSILCTVTMSLKIIEEQPHSQRNDKRSPLKPISPRLHLILHVQISHSLVFFLQPGLSRFLGILSRFSVYRRVPWILCRSILCSSIFMVFLVLLYVLCIYSAGRHFWILVLWSSLNPFCPLTADWVGGLALCYFGVFAASSFWFLVLWCDIVSGLVAVPFWFLLRPVFWAVDPVSPSGLWFIGLDVFWAADFPSGCLF